MYAWPYMKNLKCSVHAKVRKVEISLILIQGSFERFEDSATKLDNFREKQAQLKVEP